MIPTTFKVAMIQMRVRGGEREWNLTRALDLLAVAASGGAHVAVLPECMDLGWTHPSSLTAAEPVPEGTTCRRLRQAASRHAMYVCAGLTERSGDQVFNSAVLMDTNGEVLCVHRKVNELAIGHRFYAQGDRLCVVRTEHATIGVMICADALARDRVVSRSLGYLGADVILSPCAWAVPSYHDEARDPYGARWLEAYSAVAREFSMAIVGVSNVGELTDGPWEGRRCIGRSLAVDASGREIAKAAYGVDAEQVVLIDVAPVARPARGAGWEPL